MMRRAIIALLLVPLGVTPACDDYDDKVPVTPVARDPGRVTLHRLNRVEYNNTVRDLLGTQLTPADDLPPDEHGFGFDNNAGVLSLAPLQLEIYERAAELLVADVMSVPDSGPDHHTIEAEAGPHLRGSAYRDWGWKLSQNGALHFRFQLQRAGAYHIALVAAGQQAGDQPVMVEVDVDGQVVASLAVNADSDAPETLLIDDPGIELGGVVDGEPTEVVVSVTFVNDLYDPDGQGDRNLIIDSLTLSGPQGLPPQQNPLRDGILICDPASDADDACVRDILRGFASRAWRRPATDTEVERLLVLVEGARIRGDDTEHGLRLAMQAVLLSPHFLFRVELDHDPEGAQSHPLTDYELASRLSYFLWSSMPDAELFAAAEPGTLHDPEVLRAQAMRLLDSPRSRALVDNFAGQWLFTRALADHQPDAWYFPDYDRALASSMAMETWLFFDHFLRNEVPVRDMLTADFSFIDERLADHYAITTLDAAVAGHRRVPMTGSRRGLLGHASLLTVTSHPTRTSPVKRGKWVLGQLLCDEPPPPPPGVEGLERSEMVSGPLRVQMEQHRSDPVCRACHAAMDPIGFGLENFDGVGKWRTMDGEWPIDSSGQLLDGEAFFGPVELANLLADDHRLEGCITEKMFAYALGRGPREVEDAVFIEEITDAFRDQGATLRALIGELVVSEPFTSRRGEPLTGETP